MNHPSRAPALGAWPGEPSAAAPTAAPSSPPTGPTAGPASKNATTPQSCYNAGGHHEPAKAPGQGYCVVGLLLVTASMRSCGRWLARLVARAMLGLRLLGWYPCEVMRWGGNTAGSVSVWAWDGT